MPKKSKNAWFRPVRRSYLPSSWQGLAIYIMYVAYIVVLVADWYRLGSDVWTLVVNVIPLVAAAAVVTQYIASKNS